MFRQSVRRFRPSDLLPTLAKHAAKRDLMWGPGYGDMRGRTPWAVSAMARDSVLYGNDYRSAIPGETDISQLYTLFNSSHNEREDNSLEGLLGPLLYEQFPYQESQYEELSRIQALFDDPDLGPPFEWVSVFGLELHEAVRASLVLHAWVAHNGGRFDPALMDQENMQEVFDRAVPREHITAVAALLTTTIDEAKEANRAVPPLPSHAQRFAFNPLAARPLVDLGDRGIWAPQSMLVSRALHPGNLYYRGIAHWGKSFADQLGPRTEAYIGKQLRLIAGDDLRGEVTYGKAQKSVDWIWTTPEAVILVECKSARATLGARAGDGSLPAITERYIGHAREQLDRTADLIRSGAPGFEAFPADRPIVGIAVTAEAFYLGNVPTVANDTAHSHTQSVAMALRDLEHWVSMGPDGAVRRLLEVLDDDDRRTWSFSNTLDESERAVRNPILEEAWHHYDFIDPRLED